MLNYNLFESNAYKPDDAEKIFGGTTYLCQTFTPGTSHMLWAVQVKSLVSGTVTCKIYETLAGKPTGTALGTGTATSSTGVGWIDFVLSSGVRVNSGTVYAMVFSSASAVRLRYNQSGTYTAGFPYASTDSGVTWTAHTNGDFLFTEWGMSLPSGNTTRIQLYPRAEGSHTQLVPVANGLASEMPNWQCVNDPVDAPNEGTDCVAYYVTDSTGFLSGLDESVAGGLTGTSAMWRTAVDGLWGIGTSFDTELSVGDLLTSPTPNTFYPYNYRRIAEVLSIQSALALTFQPTIPTTSMELAPREIWWVTPNSNVGVPAEILHGSGLNGGEGGFYLGKRVGFWLTGTWTFTQGSEDVTGVGGAALSELKPYAWVRSSVAGHDCLVEYVTDNNHFHLNWGYAHPTKTTTSEHKAVYCSYTWTDDLTYGYGNGHAATATMWTKKTKKDSYLLKGTQAEGDIRQIDVVFRCGMTDTAVLSSTTSTCQPFLLLNGIEVLGTEITLTPHDFKTFRQTIARPGGGVFTKEDLITLEVGIVLGNLSDYQNIRKVLCTQIYAEAFVSLGDSSIETVGLTQYGFKTFDNRMDEWAMPVFPNGMNMLCHKIYHHSLTKYFSDAMQRLRGVTSRFINRRRTSTTMGKRTTSGGITH